jgi:hypothetical protein
MSKRKNKARERLKNHFTDLEVSRVEKILNSNAVTTRSDLVNITGKRDVENRKIIRVISWDRAVLFKGGYRYPKPIEEDENNEDYKAVCRDIATLNHYIEALKMRLRPMIAYKKMAEKMKPELTNKTKE